MTARPKHKTLTGNRLKIYAFCVAFMNLTKGVPPTRREITKGTGIKSTNTVNHNLLRLEELGYMERVLNRQRRSQHNYIYVPSKGAYLVPVTYQDLVREEDPETLRLIKKAKELVMELTPLEEKDGA